MAQKRTEATARPRRAHRGNRPRRIIVAVAASALVVVAAIWYLVLNGVIPADFGRTESITPSASTGSEPEPAPSRTSAPAVPGPFASPTVAASRATSPQVIPAELEPVAPSAAVEAPDGMRLALTSIENVDGKAVQPGEVSGPAIRVTITITNNTTSTLNSDLVVVNAYTGKDRRPAGALIRPGGLAFSGPVAAGETTYGIYLFGIPQADRDDVTITVDYRAGSATVVFHGKVG